MGFRSRRKEKMAASVAEAETKMAASPKTPESMLRAMWAVEPELRVVIASNPSCPSDLQITQNEEV